MKYDPRTVRFLVPQWSPFRKRLMIFGKGNTLDLQETALVIEGNLQKLHLLVADMFLRRVLCEWSTVTIPYSRVVRHFYTSYLGIKVVLWSVFGLATLAFYLEPLGLFLKKQNEATLLQLVIPLTFVIPLLVIVVLFLVLLRPRHTVEFLRADGKRCAVSFRFRSRKVSKEFVRLLDEYRRIIQALPFGAV
jgi:hypothetical protein